MRYKVGDMVFLSNRETRLGGFGIGPQYWGATLMEVVQTADYQDDELGYAYTVRYDGRIFSVYQAMLSPAGGPW